MHALAEASQHRGEALVASAPQPLSNGCPGVSTERATVYQDKDGHVVASQARALRWPDTTADDEARPEHLAPWPGLRMFATAVEDCSGHRAVAALWAGR